MRRRLILNRAGRRRGREGQIQNLPLRIRPLALCPGVSVRPCFALTAHADAGYNLTVLQDTGGLGNSDPFFGA